MSYTMSYVKVARTVPKPTMSYVLTISYTISYVWRTISYTISYVNIVYDMDIRYAYVKYWILKYTRYCIRYRIRYRIRCSSQLGFVSDTFCCFQILLLLLLLDTAMTRKIKRGALMTNKIDTSTSMVEVTPDYAAHFYNMYVKNHDGKHMTGDRIKILLLNLPFVLRDLVLPEVKHITLTFIHKIAILCIENRWCNILRTWYSVSFPASNSLWT